VVNGRGHLCNLCGSPLVPEIVAPGRGRCVECGHGFTFTTLTATAPPRTSSADRRLMAAEDRGRTRRTREAFELAPFEPHALDERWKGLRWIGGWGGSDSETSHLELGHGDDPFDPELPQVRVGTHAAADDNARAFVWGDLAQQHVNARWSATGVLEDELRRAAYPREFTGRDPTEPWSAVEIAIDGRAVQFRVLTARHSWYAQAHHGDVVVAITAGRWPVERTGLVSIFDVSEYFAGAEAMRRRAQERHRGES
jgi:hypothetical protein